jgi:hypothetical protein
MISVRVRVLGTDIDFKKFRKRICWTEGEGKCIRSKISGKRRRKMINPSVTGIEHLILQFEFNFFSVYKNCLWSLVFGSKVTCKIQ